MGRSSHAAVLAGAGGHPVQALRQGAACTFSARGCKRAQLKQAAAEARLIGLLVVLVILADRAGERARVVALQAWPA